MQNCAEIEQVTTGKAEINRLLAQASDHHRAAQEAKYRASDGMNTALWNAYQAGIALLALKPMVGHGNWQIWIDINFCKPRNCSYETAGRYMRIAAQAPKTVTGVTDLPLDSIRKYRLTYIPAKEKPVDPRDVELPSLKHHIKWINDWHKWARRQEMGHDPRADVDELKKDCRAIYDWMREELYGVE